MEHSLSAVNGWLNTVWSWSRNLNGIIPGGFTNFGEQENRYNFSFWEHMMMNGLKVD